MTRASMNPHCYDIEKVVDSEIATGTKLYFCSGCGRPRTPQMKDIRFDTTCFEKSPKEVEERIHSRMAILTAMVGGNHEHYHHKRKRRRPGDSNPAP